MKYWLIAYSRPSGELLICDEFSDGQQAIRHRFEQEQRYAGRDVEVVVLGADSLDTIKRTHSRYFAANGQDDLSRFRPGRLERRLRARRGGL